VRQYEQKKAQLKAKKSIYERLESIHEKESACHVSGWKYSHF